MAKSVEKPNVSALARQHLDAGILKPSEIKAKILADTGFEATIGSINQAKALWMTKRQTALDAPTAAPNPQKAQTPAFDFPSPPAANGSVSGDLAVLKGLKAKYGADEVRKLLEIV